MILIIFIFSLLMSLMPYFFIVNKEEKKGRVYPDDEHAFYFKELEDFMQNYQNYNLMHKKFKKIKQVKIFTDELKV